MQVRKLLCVGVLEPALKKICRARANDCKAGHKPELSLRSSLLAGLQVLKQAMNSLLLQLSWDRGLHALLQNLQTRIPEGEFGEMWKTILITST